MLGATTRVTITRPTRGSTGRLTGASSPVPGANPISVRIQPLALDPAIDPVGQEYTAVMTLPQTPALKAGDQVLWHGQTWTVKSVEWADGRGAYQRVILSSPVQ